jgi:hypothetical protein
MVPRDKGRNIHLSCLMNFVPSAVVIIQSERKEATEKGILWKRQNALPERAEDLRFFSPRRQVRKDLVGPPPRNTPALTISYLDSNNSCQSLSRIRMTVFTAIRPIKFFPISRRPLRLREKSCFRSKVGILNEESTRTTASCL